MRKQTAIILIGLLVLLVPSGRALAQSSGNEQTTAVTKTRTKISQLGVGEKARAQIRLRNGQKIKGYVSSAGPDDFAFTERDSGKTVTIAYTDVIEVKKAGGLSKGAKIAIVAGGSAVVVGLIAHRVVNCIFRCR